MIFRVHEETRGETSRSKPDTSTQWSRDLEEEIVKMSMQESSNQETACCVLTVDLELSCPTTFGRTEDTGPSKWRQQVKAVKFSRTLAAETPCIW